MGKKVPYTPRSIIKNALRKLWMWSRERSAAIKREGNTCQKCGKKGSKAKGREVVIEVHHKEGVQNWDALIDAVYEHLLCPPKKLIVLCKECHDKEDHKSLHQP